MPASFCQEEDFDPLSRATLYHIIEVREASKRKALKGIDNVAADGMAAFETLERLSDWGAREGVTPIWNWRGCS